MALDFSASGRFVSHGSAASLDDIPFGGAMTVWAWVYRASNGGNQTILSKFSTYPAGWTFTGDNATVEGEMRFVLFGNDVGATDWTDVISGTGVIALNAWTFVAGTFDDATSPEAKLFAGSLTSAVAEVPSYFRQQDGTNSPTSDAAANLYVGNTQISTANVFLGSIARAGVVNRALTLGELRQIQYASISQCNVSGTRLLVSLGGSGVTQADLSGNGNNGTVTSAVNAAHVPLGPVYALPQYASYDVAGFNAAFITAMQQQPLAFSKPLVVAAGQTPSDFIPS